MLREYEKFLASLFEGKNFEENFISFPKYDINAGYVLKQSSSIDTQLDEVFMILIGDTIMWYKNHQLERCASFGDREKVYVYGDTQVRELNLGESADSLLLFYPFYPFKIQGKTPAGTKTLFRLLRHAVTAAAKFPTLKGILYKYSTSNPEKLKQRYFVLHPLSLAMYRKASDISQTSHAHMSLYPKECVINFDDQKELIYFTETTYVATKSSNETERRKKLIIGFTSGPTTIGSYHEWKNRLESYRSKMEALSHEKVADLELIQYSILDQDVRKVSIWEIPAYIGNSSDGTLYESEIRLRSEAGGSIDKWPKYRMKLTYPPTLEFSPIEDRRLPTIIDTLTPCGSAYETSLGESTLQIVTSQNTLQVSVESTSERIFLLVMLREAIRASIIDTSDTLFQQAILRVDADEIYHLDVNDHKSIGLVFERVGEWAVVQTSKLEKQTGVSVGSILCAINDDSVLLRSYRDTVSRMRKIKPPLRLSFRRCPRKEDVLMKLSKGADGVENVWKKRYFVLANNTLTYYAVQKEGTNYDNVKKGIQFNLIGARVGLLNENSPYVADEEMNAFVLASGLSSITIRCRSHKQTMEWAASVYHAIALANGGGYVVAYEGDRMALLAPPKQLQVPLEGVDFDDDEYEERGGGPVESPRNPSISGTEENLLLPVIETPKVEQVFEPAPRGVAEEEYQEEPLDAKAIETFENVNDDIQNRQARSYTFDLQDEASEEDLRYIFRMCVGQKRRSSMRYINHRSGSGTEGFINAMQFSNLWRRLTGERGNLYREMQMFKLFDVQGHGILTEDDFVDGWAHLVDHPLHKTGLMYDGHTLLKKVKIIMLDEY